MGKVTWLVGAFLPPPAPCTCVPCCHADIGFVVTWTRLLYPEPASICCSLEGKLKPSLYEVKSCCAELHMLGGQLWVWAWVHSGIVSWTNK